MGTKLNEKEEECRFIRLLPDGTPVVRMQDREREVEIDGLEIPQPPSPLYCDIFNQRLPRLGKPLRCTVHEGSRSGRMRARFYCYGWHDKTGDVWLDLALILLDEGVATVDKQRKFPGREEYLRHEREARQRGDNPRAGKP